MPRNSRLSIDQGIKELLQLRPQDAFAFLLPDIHAHRGDPTSWEFLSTHVRKKDLRSKGFAMDLCIRYEFPSGTPLLMVLVEHWATARSIDLVRTAHYYLDLLGRFPESEVIPVALITELELQPVQSNLVGSGAGEDFMRFHTRVVQLASQDCTEWANASNLVAATLMVAMGGQLDRVHKILLSIESLRRVATDREVELLFPMVVDMGRLTDDEEEKAMSYLATAPKPRLLVKMEQRAREQGQREKAREDARRMLDHGIAWAIITDVTGIRPEDILETDTKA